MIRPSRGLFLASAVAAACLALNAHSYAQTNPPIEKFLGSALDHTGPKPIKGPKIQIELEKWSTDADAERLQKAVGGGPDKLLAAVKGGPAGSATGLIISPGIQGSGARARLPRKQPLLFARDIKTANGRQIVLATDEHLQFVGTVQERIHPENDEFTLIDIRFGKDGKGIAKMGLANDVAYNKTTNTIELANFDKATPAITDITAEKIEKAGEKK